MRSAGVLLTALALLLVQAPWIVCGCADDPTCAPVFVGKLTHAAHGDADCEDCCNPGAHLAHGSTHGHGARCNGHHGQPPRGHRHGHHHGHHDQGCSHGHGMPADSTPADGTPAESGDPKPGESDDHVGFRLPFGTMPAPVALDDAPAAAVAAALFFDAASLPTGTAQLHAWINDPPGPPIAPSVVTERLLL